MKFISPEAGQAIQLFLIDEIRPLRGGPFMPDLIANAVRRYRFATFPKEFTPGQPLKFEYGVAGEVGNIAFNGLEIYNDGVIVNATHTDDADLVMNEFLQWAKGELKLREPQTRIPRRHYSRVVIDFDEGLDNFLNDFQKLNETVTNALGLSGGMHVARLAFAVDPAPQVLTSWQIEARLGVPFAAKRYFSSAPLSTNAHLDMLSALERLSIKAV
jgi:hypothetical protein